MEGPTKNTTYNETLASWGPNALPECEYCERDLAGLDVCETNLGWFCTECYEAGHGFAEGSDDSDRAAERRQMGISS